MQAEIEQMLKQDGGWIINTSSQGDVTGFPGQAAYISCKHGVIGLTRTVSMDYAAKNIRINAVCPGDCYADVGRGSRAQSKTGRNCRCGDWVMRSKATFVHGHALLVDGGFTVH